ncbi:GntR family transcriptional regulator [Arthrobacter crystallopoietes]|uniref:GntR family transcriptional regulator n=1 Tax=Crystallibacter crystallopoietes TaxID=37928 RepID=UPI001ABEC2F5|nr:GntR family transcriptional regulator [Arthrobacter crystallopoietes]QTG80294.1 GntR family transcriptional regulator [Arthrobacter crystallopoietes]
MSTALFGNESLSERVKQTILDRVIDGTYQPGTRLIELQLAKEFGVSQAPVREALRELSSTRLVENIPRRGTFVRAASQDDLAEVYLVRLALEGTAAACAYPVLHADPSPLRDALEGMRAAAAAGDAHGIARFSTDFHRAVIVATGNRLMLEIWNSLFVEARTLATVIRGHVDLHAAAEAHAPILAAFEHGTPEECTRLVTEHQHEYSILPQD